MADTGYRTWAEINLDSLAHNINIIRKIVGNDCEIMGAVKADAYGHGVIACAKEMLSCGVNRLAVATLDEAIELRHANIIEPILVLNHTDERLLKTVVNFDITQTVFSLNFAKKLSQVASELGQIAKIHIKLDTGMGRIGFQTNEEAVKEIVEIYKLPSLEIEGIYSHFSMADTEDQEYCMYQYDNFVHMCNRIKEAGVYIPLKHIANSAAICRYPMSHFNIVRPGIIQYGILPSHDFLSEKLDLKPVMTLKTTILHIKTIEKGMSVSYGRNFRASKESRIATLAIGYGDGYMRILSGKAEVMINGQRAPVVGNICMDQCMVDITNISGDIKVGDQVILFGEDLSVDELADKAETISYEIVTCIGRRVPRVYIKNGVIQDVLNYLL